MSNKTIDVVEGEPPPRVTCTGTAYPPLQYHWYREGQTSAIGYEAGLQLYTDMTRADAGDYICVSSNKHGNQSAVMKMNILCTFSPLVAAHTDAGRNFDEFSFLIPILRYAELHDHPSRH